MKINRLSKELVAFWTCQSMPIHLQKKKFEHFLTWCFQKLSSFSYCWWRQTIEKDYLSFDRVYTSIYIFTWITENQQVHCIHYHLLKRPCFPDWHYIFVTFLVKVKKWVICKRAKSTQIWSSGYLSLSIAVGAVVFFRYRERSDQ